MQSDAKLNLRPRLRFPEFRDGPGWEIGTLKSVCQMQAGKFVSASEISGLPRNGYFPCYGGNGLRGYTKSYTHSGKYPLIGRQGALCGNVKLATGKFHATEHALVATAHGEVDVDWLFYALELSNLNKYATGQAQPGLSVDVLEKVPIALPRLKKEQQEIAECLSTLDELIGAENQKLDALKAHKKGLMQQLFPREGETLPRLRFPEFQSAPEWEEFKFKEVVARSFYGTSDSTSEKGKYPVLRMGNMADGQLDFSNLVYIDLEEAEFEKLRIRKGDILLNRTNSYDLVGKISLFNSEIECITASYIVTYRLRSDLIVPHFCNYLLNTGDYQARIKVFATRAVSQANINPTTFQESLAIALPKPSEQQRIASCLSSLDDLITAQSDKLDALNAHKKGLMQRLFPSMEEVVA